MGGHEPLESKRKLASPWLCLFFILQRATAVQIPNRHQIKAPEPHLIHHLYLGSDLIATWLNKSVITSKIATQHLHHPWSLVLRATWWPASPPAQPHGTGSEISFHPDDGKAGLWRPSDLPQAQHGHQRQDLNSTWSRNPPLSQARAVACSRLAFQSTLSIYNLQTIKCIYFVCTVQWALTDINMKSTQQ